MLLAHVQGVVRVSQIHYTQMLMLLHSVNQLQCMCKFVITL